MGEDVKTLSDCAAEILFGKEKAWKDQLAVVGERLPNLALNAADGEALPPALEQEASHAIGHRLVLLGLDEHQVEAGGIAVRDEGVPAVYDPPALGSLAQGR